MPRKLFQISIIVVMASVLAGCIGLRQQVSTPAPSTGAVASPTAVAPAPAVPAATATPAVAAAPAPAGDEWWRSAMFYEIFVRSFADSNGDGIGDFQGLTQKLDYLNDGDPATTTDLGITGIWLMPIHPSPSYHGYDVTDYYGINPQYGTMEDFRAFLAAAHARGIRVIIDLVMNHSSTQHPWFLQSVKGDPAYQDWYLWSDTDPGYLGPWSQRVWHKASNGKYYYGIFWDQMPDLNLANPAVKEEMHKVIRFWLEDVKIDGFRLDAVRHYVEDGRIQENSRSTHQWLGDFYTYYKGINPDAFTVGEAWTATAAVVEYIGDEVDTAFEFDLAQALVNAARGPIAIEAGRQLQVVLDSYPQGQYATFLTNHDQDRINSLLKDDERAKLAATMLLTSPGIPFLYYGEEIGMTGVKPDEDIRRPMQWQSDSARVGFSTKLPWRMPANDFKQRSVALQEADPNSLLNHYRALLHLRSQHPALSTGETVVLDPDSPRLFALLRYDDAEAFLVLVNVHDQPLAGDRYQINLPSGPFQGPVQATTVLGPGVAIAPTINAQGGIDAYVPFSEIPGKTSVIIRLAN